MRALTERAGVGRRFWAGRAFRKHFRDLLPKGTANVECQLQVGAKSAPFNGVDCLARHTGTIPPPRAAQASEF
jgi:hypothetical protein